MSGFLVVVSQGRTRDFEVLITTAAGTAVTLAADDVIRVKIGRRGGTPDLDLDSIEPTEDGSSVTFTAGTNTATVRLAQGDTEDLTPGVYDVEVAVVDNSEETPANAIKEAEKGTLVICRSMGGEIGDEESSSSSSSS